MTPLRGDRPSPASTEPLTSLDSGVGLRGGHRSASAPRDACSSSSSRHDFQQVLSQTVRVKLSPRGRAGGSGLVSWGRCTQSPAPLAGGSAFAGHRRPTEPAGGGWPPPSSTQTFRRPGRWEKSLQRGRARGWETRACKAPGAICHGASPSTVEGLPGGNIIKPLATAVCPANCSFIKNDKQTNRCV